MKKLNDDDKEFLTIMLAIIFLTFSFFVCIFATIRKHNSKPTNLYEEQCIVNYVKYPLKECTYKEVK